MADDFTDSKLDELEATVQRLGTTIRQCNDRMDVQLNHLETSIYIFAQRVVHLSQNIEGSDFNISVELQRALQVYRSPFPDTGSLAKTTEVVAMPTFVDVANELKGDDHPAVALEDSITEVDLTTTAMVAVSYKDEVLEDAEVADNDADNSNHQEIEHAPTSGGVVISNSNCVVTQMMAVEFASHNSFDGHNENAKFVWPPHVLPMNWPRQRWGDYDNGSEKCLGFDPGYLHFGWLCLLSNTEIVPMLHYNSGINKIQMILVFDPGASTVEARKRVRKAFSQPFFWTWQNSSRINTITNMAVFSSTINVPNILNFSNECASAGQYAFKLPFEIRSCGCLNVTNWDQRSYMPSSVSIHSFDKRAGLNIRYIESKAATKITTELDESELDNGPETIIDWDGRDEDEEEFCLLLKFVKILKVAEARGVKLPSAMTESAKTTGIWEMFLLRYLELQDTVWPLGFLIKHCSMLRNQMPADPSSLFKVGTEIAIDSCCATYFYKGSLYGLVGFGGGLIGQGIANMIMNAKRNCNLVVAFISSSGVNREFAPMLYPLIVSYVGILVCLLTTLFAFAIDFNMIKAVNDIEQALTNQLGISTFFMIIRIAIATWVAYHGPRNANLLVQYQKMFVASNVYILDPDYALSDFVEAAGNFFPIYIGFGLNNSWFSVAKDFPEDVMVLYGFDKVPALVSSNPSYNERSTFYRPFEEEFMEDFVKQNLIPLVVPVSHDTLKLMGADGRKIALTIVKDENEKKTKELIKLLKAAASANHDLIFSYVGVTQLEEFTEKSDVSTELPNAISIALHAQFSNVDLEDKVHFNG